MAESERSNGQKLGLLLTIVFDGVLAVLAALIPSIYAAFLVLLLTVAVQFVLIWQLRLFEKRRFAGTLIVWGCVVVLLSWLWWIARPKPQAPAVTRSELQEELQKLQPTRPEQTPQPSPSPSEVASPSPSASASPFPSPKRTKKSAAERERERIDRALNSSTP